MTKKTETDERPLIVQKYGGSSLADPEHIRRVAANILDRKGRGADMVIVVSAMGKTTDQFIEMARELNPSPDGREMDMLLSVGERISIALLALAINATGRYRAVSYTGSQIGIITDNAHTQARILEVKGHRLREALKEDKIVIVAGFQGVSINKEITTLGRGGSDTTAVALAAALGADSCEIMSDIDGIYTADPRAIPVARRIDRIDYDLTLEMASSGARMLHRTSVEFAKRHRVKLALGSSFTGQIGTIVTDESLSRGNVTAVTTDLDVVLFRFPVRDELELPRMLCSERLTAKLWQQAGDRCLLGTAQCDAERAQQRLEDLGPELSREESWALLSLIGTGVGLGTAAAEQLMHLLIRESWPCAGVVSHELSTRVLLPRGVIEKAARLAHEHFFES